MFKISSPRHVDAISQMKLAATRHGKNFIAIVFDGEEVIEIERVASFESNRSEADVATICEAIAKQIRARMD